MYIINFVFDYMEKIVKIFKKLIVWFFGTELYDSFKYAFEGIIYALNITLVNSGFLLFLIALSNHLQDLHFPQCFFPVFFAEL